MDRQTDRPTDRLTMHTSCMCQHTHTHTHTHTHSFCITGILSCTVTPRLHRVMGLREGYRSRCFSPVSQRELSNHRKLKASLLTSEINQLDFILRPSSNSNFSTSIHNVAKILVYIHNVILYYFFYTKFSKHYTIRL